MGYEGDVAVRLLLCPKPIIKRTLVPEGTFFLGLEVN
jgi:hypothetical protein